MKQENYLVQKEAVKKLQDLISEIDVCLFQSGLSEGDASSYRPMSTKGVDEEGNIWFFSPRDSEKNREINRDPHVRLIYSHPGKSSFLILTGEAQILFDQEKINELWNSLDKTWFKEGKDDPNISILKITPDSGHYWDTKGNQMINFLKMIASAATGTTLVEGEEGRLKI